MGSTVAAEARLGKEVQGTVVKEQCICTQVKSRPVLAPTGISECILAVGSQLGYEAVAQSITASVAKAKAKSELRPA